MTFQACTAHGHRTTAEAEDCALRAIADRAQSRIKRDAPMPRLWPIGHTFALSGLADSLPEEALLDALFGILPGDMRVDAQRSVVADRGRFRLDVAIVSATNESVRVAVEVDGFAYHDRTPEQAERDKQRDRALTRAGWRVLRFSAAEVLRNPKACAIEIVVTVKAIDGEREDGGDVG